MTTDGMGGTYNLPSFGIGTGYQGGSGGGYYNTQVGPGGYGNSGYGNPYGGAYNMGGGFNQSYQGGFQGGYTPPAYDPYGSVGSYNAMPSYSGGNSGAYMGNASSNINQQLMQTLQANPYMTAQQAYQLAQQAQSLGSQQQLGQISTGQGLNSFNNYYSQMQPSVPQVPWNYTPQTSGQPGFGAGFGGLSQGATGQPGLGLNPGAGPYPGMISPPNVGSAGLVPQGEGGVVDTLQEQLPAFRSVQQIEADAQRGISYSSDEERKWYLNQKDPSGQLVQRLIGGGPVTPPRTGEGDQPAIQPVGGGGGVVGPGGLTPEQQAFVQWQRGRPYDTDEARANFLAWSPLMPGSGATGTGGANWAPWGELPGGRIADWAAAHGYGADKIIYAGQNSFNQRVEDLRPLVSQFFQPGDVNHALWIIQRESQGANILQGQNPDGSGTPRGPGTGLFQIEHGGYINPATGRPQYPDRPSQQQLLDPYVNLGWASKMVYGR